MAKANAKANATVKPIKKQKGQRDNEQMHKVGRIIKLIKLDYIADVECWCKTRLQIDSSKSIAENVCPGCGSPFTLIQEEWTQEKLNEFEKFRKITS